MHRRHWRWRLLARQRSRGRAPDGRGLGCGQARHREKQMMKKQAIRTDKAPTPTGPFNQAIRAGNMVFCSSQAGRNRETGKMGDISDQARRCIGNLANVLEAAGSSLADVVKVTVFLRNAEDWKSFNEEYVKLM